MKLGWESIMLHSGQSKALAPKKKSHLFYYDWYWQQPEGTYRDLNYQWQIVWSRQ